MAVIAWGVILWFVGSFVSNLGVPGVFGWVAYAPLSHNAPAYPGAHLTPLEDLFVWIALIALWGLGALLLLRSEPADRQSGS